MISRLTIHTKIQNRLYNITIYRNIYDMPHISNKKVKRKIFLKIHDQFIQTISTLKNKNQAKQFIGELLTSTEKIMIAKRLAIIIMLKHNYSIYQIKNSLKVSPSTVARLRDNIDEEKYKCIESFFRFSHNKTFRKNNFMDHLEKFILMGMPARVGENRWKFMSKSKR